MSDLCFLTAIELAANDVEATTIANEGVIGIGVILGVASTTMEALCQIPGRALKVSTRAVLEEIRPRPA